MKTQQLKILAQQATPWPWKWFTSNSHKRLSSVASGKDGDVISAFKAADGAACVSISQDNMAFIEAAHPGAVIELIERLEAAERERDELRAEQAEHDEQIARMESKFSLAKRALDSKTVRCEKAEAELRRRDAAAGEPFAEIKWDGTEMTVQNVRHGFSYGVTQVYAAAQSSEVAGTGETVAYQIHSDLEGWRECTPERYAEVSARPLIDGKYSGGWLLRKLYTAPPAASAPDGYCLRLIPIEGTDAFRAACTVAFEEFNRGTGPCGVFIAGHRPMLAAVPAPGGDDVKQG